MMNGERKEGICRLNVDGNGCDYLRILSDLETKLRNNTNPKEKIELALQGALMFYGADRAYVIEVDDELGIGVNTYECCAPGIAPEIDNLQFMPFEMFPRWLCSLKSDTPIIITDLEQIKTEFLEEYRYLEKRSVNSLLAVPFQKRLNAGFLGVDNPKRNVEDPGFLRLVILCIVVELNEILLQEWRERRYASIKQPTIIQANLFGKLEIISSTDVLKDDSFTNESGYVLLTFLLLNRKREHPLRLLTDIIWESTDMENPYNSIKNVVYRLRSTLACIGIRDLIQASHGTFTLNPNYTIFTDVERFDDACKRIDNSSDPAILQALYESIIGLYRGSLLPRYDFYHWLMPKTLYYQNKFLHYMKRYLSMLYREKHYLRVQELSMDLLSIDMYESEVHYYLIKAMLMSGSKTLSQIYFRQAEPYLTDEHMQEVKTLFTSCRT